MSSAKEPGGVIFAERVQRYLRRGGFFQKNLAKELGLHHKVLNRKLHGTTRAYLTNEEVKKIIFTLADWKAIVTRAEALELLHLAMVDPNIISESEWCSPPLSELALETGKPGLSSASSALTHSARHNLPTQITPLIGRAQAVEELRHLLELDTVRLVTMIGPGGSGKTRLALHVANTLVDTFDHGVWFVELAAVRNPAQVPMSILQALNIRLTPDSSPFESLVNYLRTRRLVLVLDNFEQLAEGATIVSKLLATAPGLKIVITSRVILQLSGEQVFNVLPLNLPGTGTTMEPAALERYGAIQLFVARARAIEPNFSLTAQNAAAIAQICGKLDGLPLALELAAAHIKVLGPAKLLEKLAEKMLPILIGGSRDLPGRQQTMRNTIIWSYNLLSPSEKMWFCRFGVFNGSWSLEATEALMRDIPAGHGYALPPDSALVMIEQLLNSCLLVRQSIEQEQARFSMLETLREYAVEQLTEQGEIERLRDWHACYYLTLAETGAAGLRGPQQFEWLKRLTAERDNFQAALEWSLQKAREGKKIQVLSPVSGRARGAGEETTRNKRSAPGASCTMEMLALELCLRLAAALRPFWEWRGYLDESRSELQASLEISEHDVIQQSVLVARAQALSEMSRLTSLQNDQPRAVELAEESIALWRQLDDPQGLAAALFHRGWPTFGMAEYEVGQRVFTQGLELLSPTGDRWWRGQFLFYLGTVAAFLGDFEQMRLLHAQALDLFEREGDRSAIADLLKDQGGLVILESKYDESIGKLIQSLQISHELDHKQYITTALGWLGFAVGLRGLPDPESASLQAAKVWGAAEGRQSNTGFTPWIKNIGFIEQVKLYIQSRVDEELWNAAYNAGKDMSEEEAIAFACSLKLSA
ncbi:MAG TPA: NB-ARC domain-containing protein [Ktedonobacteraceae bacterium]|jgi:predicted ATPase|nr:NB-ARC domain-containing protein [Ktedonobacteraceae bacterium]